MSDQRPPMELSPRDAELIALYAEDLLTEEQSKELNARLHAEPDLLAAIVQLTEVEEHMRVLLEEAHASDPGDWYKVMSELARAEERHDELPPIHLEANALTRQKYVSALTYVLEHTFTPKCIAALATAAALLLGVVLAIAFLTGGPDEPDRVVEAPDQPTIVPQAPIAQHVVATLTAEYDAVWDRQPGVDLYAGQRFTLTQGYAEVTTSQGAVAILEAPATVELMDDRNAIRLHTGKLTGICETDTSKGFAVYTPTAKLVDVGTVFGVEVTPGNTTQLHVIRGQVNAAPITADERVGIYTRVTANQAVTIQAEKPVQSVVFDRKRFALSLPAALPRPIVANDEILLDLGWMGQETETREGNYNNLGGEADGLIFTVDDQPRSLLQNMIRSSDGTSTTVGFSIQQFHGETDTIIGFGTADLGASAPALSGFPASVTRDTVYMQSRGGDQPSEATLRFSGLDDSLVYELTLVSYIKSTEHRQENYFAASGQSGSYNPVGGGTVTLKGLTTDGQGNLDIVWTCSGSLGSVGGQLDGIRLIANQP